MAFIIQPTVSGNSAMYRLVSTTTYILNIPTLPTNTMNRVRDGMNNSFYNTYKRIITLWLIVIPLQILEKHTFMHT